MFWGLLILYVAGVLLVLGLFLPAILYVRARIHRFARDRRIRKAAADFGRHVDAAVIDQILTEPPDTPTLLTPAAVSASRARRATVGRTNVRGWVALCEQLGDAESVKLLNEHIASVTLAVREHGGIINELLGDQIVFVFNAVNPDPDHARNALLAAARIRDAAGDLARRHPGFAVHIGLATGTVILGDLGGGGFTKFACLGTPPVHAARLADLPDRTSDTRILLDNDTAEHARTRFQLRDLPPLPVEGAPRPVPVVELGPALSAR